MAEAASSTPSRIFSGRKQESAVWKYFAYNEEIKKKHLSGYNFRQQNM